MKNSLEHLQMMAARYWYKARELEAVLDAHDGFKNKFTRVHMLSVIKTYDDLSKQFERRALAQEK